MDNSITKWEYKQISGGEEELNKMGEQGWEAVGQRGYNVLMKRPKLNQQNPKQKLDTYDYGFSR